MQIQPPAPGTVLLLAVVVEGGLAVLAVGLGWFLGSPPLESMRGSPAALAWGAAASLPMLLGFAAFLRIPWGPFRRLLRVVEELLVPVFRRCRVVELAGIALLAGVGEEMFFRGMLQEALAARLDGPLGFCAGLVLASILFGLLHPLTPTYAVLAALMGLYLGWLWMATDNLLVPISAHAVYDFVALVYLVKIRPVPPPPCTAE